MSDWFDRVTGTNEYERQSWRDSYNDGKAAGDWTGATNQRLSEERDSFQGATWSGSSTEYSALEVAQLRGAAPDRAATAVGSLASGATTGGLPRTSYAAPGRPSAASVLAVGGAGAFGNNMAKKPQDMVLGGFLMQANPYYSNAEDGEARGGEIYGEFTGLMAVGSDLGHNAARMYFGENYRALNPGQRVAIIGERAQQGVKTGWEAGVDGIFSAYDSIQQWAENNRKQELAGLAAAAEVDAAWDARMEIMDQEVKDMNARNAHGGFFWGTN